MAEEYLSYKDILKPDNSLTDAIAALEKLGDIYAALTNQIKTMAAEAKTAISGLDKRTKAGREQAEAIAAGVNEAYEAYLKLTNQQTTVGKTLEFIRQQMAQNRKAYKEEFDLANTIEGSYKNLELRIKELTNYWKSLDPALAKSSFGQKIKAQIDALRAEYDKLRGIITPMVTEQDKLDAATQRYIDKLNALRTSGAAWAQAKADVDAVTIALTRQYDQWKKLENARTERDWLKSAEGQDYMRIQQEITAIREAMKPTVDWQEKLTRATQEYIDKYNAMRVVGDSYTRAKAQLDAYTRSMQEEINLQISLNEAGQRYADIQRGILYVDNQLTLNDTRTKEKAELEALNRVNNDYLRLKRLEQQAAMYETGSYKQRSIEYQKLTLQIKLMATDTEELRRKKLELQQQANELYIALRREDEAMDDYHRSVGNYNRVWDGLKHSINQVVRELPSLSVSLNTFFLAISNNIPMLVEEIQKAKEKNNDLAAAGKKTIPVYKQIAAAIFSWQTALILLLTILPKYGEQIIDGIKEIIKGRKEIIKTTGALKNMSEEVTKNTKEYGKNIVSLKKLGYEWKNLTDDTSRLQWIKDNKTEFDKLDVSVKNVTDAENIFSKNTEIVVKAFKLRAKAAAATKLAMDEYGKVVESELQAERYSNIRKGKEEEPGFFQNLWATATNLPAVFKGWLKGIWDLYEAVEEYSNETAEAGTANAEKYLAIVKRLEEEASKLLDSAGIEEAHKYDKEKKGPKGRTPRDPFDTVNNMYLKVQKKYEESITALQLDELKKRREAMLDTANATIRELENIYEKNERLLANVGNKFQPLTQEQKDKILQAQEWIKETIENIDEAWAINDAKIEWAIRIRTNETEIKNIETQLKSLKEGSEEAYKLQVRMIELRNEIASMQNSQAIDEERIDSEALYEAGLAEIEKLNRSHQIQMLEITKSGLEQRLAATKANTKEFLDLQIEVLEQERKIALLQNEAMAPEVRMHPSVIDADFQKRIKELIGQADMTRLEQLQELEKAKLEETEAAEIEITKLTLEHERNRLSLQIQLAKKGMLDWSKEQIEAAEATVRKIDKELKKIGSFISRVGELGLGGALLEKLGFNDEQIEAMSDWANVIIDAINEIVDAEVEAAEKAVEAYEKRVNAAQSAYDAEVEARNNGYANNVATAKKELQQEKKNLQQKQKLLEEAQRRQEAINSLTQASSLITAAANIWSAFSSLSVVGPILAAAAIATMFGSFAYAKIRAKQITSQAQAYGEGGLEFLEGGSHASGNDIDLGVQNKRKRRMKAEGGEALAIVNKRNTRKYRRVLPDIIESLNKGNFEDRYLNAFSVGENLALTTNLNSNIDLSRIENDVNYIRKQRETQYFTTTDGSIIVQRKNVRRVIHK